MARAITRQSWVFAHRWAGLTLALFLAVAGFTGIFLAWVEELEELTGPGLHSAAPPSPDAAMIDPLTLREQALERYPDALVDFLPLEVEQGKSLRLHLHWQDPASGEELEAPTGFNDLFIDPYSGEELGRREWGNIFQGAKNIMPFVYRLHYSLALDDIGLLVFGLAALIWVFDCFIGLFLTFPVRKRAALPRDGPADAPGWFRRWGKSWKIRRKTTPYKLNFDLHRAGGLWIWPLLLVFAWSSVSFNLPQVYVPVMQQFGAEDPRQALLELTLPEARDHPALSFREALPLAEQRARELAGREGLAILEHGERWLWHVPTSGVYIYGFTTSADISTHGGGTRVAVDSDSGALKAVEIPSGANGANTFGNWLAALHMGQAFGWWWRVAVSLIGAMVTMLSVTGVVIWLKKRSGRAGRRLRGERQYGQSVPAE